QLLERPRAVLAHREGHRAQHAQRRQDGQVEVTQGIGPADAVVAIGAAFLNDGDAVRLAGPGEAASAPAGAAR
ncbi:hypothetical protein ACQUWY_24210, partial [Ralstonia pseudosolanacearum]